MTGSSFFFPWEVSMIEWAQNSLGSVGTAISRVFTLIGGETVTLVILLVILFCYNKEAGKRCGLTILAASMWFPMIKNVVLRIRPYMEHESIRALSVPEGDADPMDIVQQGYSFPSGHSAMALSMYGSLAMEIRKKWAWFIGIALILLIGMSRFIMGVHYPTDVLAGWAVGLLALAGGTLLNRKVKKEWVRYAILLAISLPGIFWCTSRDYYTALGLLIGMTIAFPLEEKICGYRDTRNPFAMALRVIGAMIVYFASDVLLKLPFSREFLNNGTLGANLIRTARYVVISILLMAVYPKAFVLFEKVGPKKAKE